MPVDSGILSLSFRPVSIEPTVKIKDSRIPIIYNSPQNTSDEFVFTPKITIKILNNKIQQARINYTFNGEEVEKELKKDNDTFIFNDNEVEAIGNSFNYPFDEYSSNLTLYP